MNIMKYWQVFVAVAAIISAASIAQFQIQAMAEDVKEAEAEQKKLIDLFNQLKETDIRTEGQLKLEVQRLNSSIAAQSAKLDQLLFLLQEDRRN